MGCSNVDEEIINVDKEKSNVDGATALKRISITPVDDLYLFEIEGHQYIIYDGIYCGGIIHAEHCPCKNTNN